MTRLKVEEDGGVWIFDEVRTGGGVGGGVGWRGVVQWGATHSAG